MNTRSRLSAIALAVAASVPLSLAVLPTQALAQSKSSAVSNTPRIESFDAKPLEQLRPGEVISFELKATPGATVSLQIDGATAPVRMSEVRSGAYEGSYTIRTKDQLTSASRVKAIVLKNGKQVTASLTDSLLAGAPAFSVASSQSISDFKVEAPDRVRPGDEVNFSVMGDAGAKARVAIDGAGAAVPLREVSRGVYEGSYVVRRQDKLRGDLKATAYLVSDGRESKQRYEQSNVKASCALCGKVESVNVVDVKSDASNAVGTIAGGVLGGVLGNQVGGGRGKDVARVIGAVGGAYAGNRVQNNMNKEKVYRVTVRMQDGSTQDVDYAEDPAVAVGTQVKIEEGVLVRR